jgi:prepilin-type N-terminal cleavage/methylation domain-containing protein
MQVAAQSYSASARRHICELRHSGFTLIEVLICLAILTILISLAIPAFGKARRLTIKLSCDANIRNAGLILETYSASVRGALPFGPYQRQEMEWPGVGTVGWGGRPGLRSGTWAFLFPDEWSNGQWNQSMRCPLKPEFQPQGGPSIWDSWPTPAYFMTEGVWMDERDLQAESTPGTYAPKPHHASDVRFPSAKAYLLEFPTFCATEPETRFGIELGQTPNSKASMYFFDGSVQRHAVSDGLPGSGGAYGFLWTIDGVRGRDLR